MKEFIDEFKHLEKICNEIYSEQHGVTLYINDMELNSGYASRIVPDWDKDIAYLKRVRHIRNNLVHESDEVVDYDSSDIEFMKTFYQKIITQQDPLALLRKNASKSIKPQKSNSIKESTYIKHSVVVDDEREDKPINQELFWGLVLAGLIILLLILIFVL